MRLTRPALTRFTGRAFVAVIWLALLILVAVFGLVYAVYADFKAPDRSRLTSLTRSEYLADVIYGRFRSSWGITPDPQLAYVPKVGASRMRSPEYDVTMTYDPEGVRRQPPVAGPRGELVVMAGDSFTAGLGVEDHQTFSALLQTRHHHTTVNTGVISYSTARELWRLRRLNLLTTGAVFVIQYCDNDAAENRRFLARPFEALGRTGGGETWAIGRRQEQLELTYLNVFRASVQQMRLLTGTLGYRTVARDIAGERQSPGSPIVLPDFTPAQLAADFLAVLDHFPELAHKPIIVIDLNTRGSSTGILTALRSQARSRPNLEVLSLRFEPEDFFRFDGHLNARGHATVAAQLHPAIERSLRK